MSHKPSMKQILKELRTIAKKHGYEVRIYTYDRLKDDNYIRFFSPKSPSGDFHKNEKKIIIRKYRNTFLKTVIWVLAHEIAHLIHVVEGKYPRYYSKYWDKQVTKYYTTYIIPNKLDISPFLQGVRAEIDCDRWANEFLIKRGHSPKSVIRYPIESVMGYELYARYMERNKRCLYIKL